MVQEKISKLSNKQKWFFVLGALILLAFGVYATTISDTNSVFGGNLTGEWIFAKLNWSNVQNVPNNVYTTFNATYNLWAYNQTIAGSGDGSYNLSYESTYNSTYALWAYNQTVFYGFYNLSYESTFNSSYLTSLSETDPTVNRTFNQTLTDSLYSSKLWNYNQTIYYGFYNLSYVSTYNASYLTSYTETDSIAMGIINTNNASWLAVYNQTYESTFNSSYIGNNVLGKNISVESDNKICLNGVTCTKYIFYNGSNVIIQG